MRKNFFSEKTYFFQSAQNAQGVVLCTGASGVMVFRVGCDKLMDDPNSVACGIENALHRYVENW